MSQMQTNVQHLTNPFYLYHIKKALPSGKRFLLVPLMKNEGTENLYNLSVLMDQCLAFAKARNNEVVMHLSLSLQTLVVSPFLSGGNNPLPTSLYNY